MPKAKSKPRTSRQTKPPYAKVESTLHDSKSSKIAQKCKKTRNKRSASLTWFLKVYKGLNDWHLPIFEAVEAFIRPNKVLYPGSDKHLTASLLFRNVVYVDFNQKLQPVFKDPNVIDWIKENKKYTDEPQIKFLCKNFDFVFEKLNSFDLLISACAGIVSTSCSKYLKPGGHFLVSDAHFDARTIFLRPDFHLVAVYDTISNRLDDSPDSLKGHFITTAGSPITSNQVSESINKPKNKRSFKLQKEAMFYLFKKIGKK